MPGISLLLPLEEKKSVKVKPTPHLQIMETPTLIVCTKRGPLTNDYQAIHLDNNLASKQSAVEFIHHSAISSRLYNTCSIYLFQKVETR